MSLSHSPKIVTNGLAFAYDMGPNPGVNKSWKGMPVTNVVTNTNLDTGWSKSYNTSIQWNDYRPPNGINSQVVSFIDSDGNGSGYWYSYGDYAPQDPSTTYAISVYARTIGADWGIRGYTADNSEVGRQSTNNLTCPGDGKWHRLEFDTITTPSNTQSDSLSFNFYNMPANQRCWLCAPQMTATSFHVPFVNGTRSNTQSLLDWTGKNTINANSLTYNSDGTFSFDGTTNFARFGNNAAISSIGGTSSITVESWVKYDSYVGSGGSRSYSVVTHKGTPWTWLMENPSNKGRIRFTIGGTDVNCADPDVHPLNTWMHWVGTYDGSNMKFYRNGILKNTVARTGTLGSNSTNAEIGQYSNDYRMDGDISIVKIYNRALTSAEVAQNFNALRGRYGI